jgi:hypothetical protein
MGQMPAAPLSYTGRCPGPDDGAMDRLWKQALQEGAVAGSVAAVVSAVALVVAGRRDAGSAAAAINAEGHWLWGDAALRADGASAKYTLSGYVTHHLSNVFWATLYARVWGHRPEAKAWPQALAGGIATSAAAALIDYSVVPRRLTPGFENRLSAPSMVGEFGAIAVGLTLGALVLGRSR